MRQNSTLLANFETLSKALFMSENSSSEQTLSADQIIEYIKLQWVDIQHSRTQEWTIFALVAGIFVAMPQKLVEDNFAEPMVALLGFFFAIIGARVAWRHKVIFSEKVKIIGEMEKRIGIEYRSKPVFLSVQVLIFLIFALIAAAYAAIAAFFITKNWNVYKGEIWPLNPQIYKPAIVFGVIIASFVLYAYIKYKSERKRLSNQSKIPFYVENEDVESCLNELGENPLKLVVNKLISKNKFKEESWIESKWAWSKTEDKITKQVLTPFKDIFQFSVANSKSKQDWHYHEHVFEIYVSSEKMSLYFEDRDNPKLTEVKNGIIIVPPEIKHKIVLTGLTYVFQATMNDGGLSEDKVPV